MNPNDTSATPGARQARDMTAADYRVAKLGLIHAAQLAGWRAQDDADFARVAAKHTKGS